jgi:hypothetical protein
MIQMENIVMSLINDILTSPNLVATLALVVSVISIGIGFWGSWRQQIHNKLSVRPIGHINLSDYDNMLAIAIENAGMGSMIIKSIETTDEKGNKKDNPIDWIQSDILLPEFKWRDFRTDLQNLAIKEGNSVILLDYRLDPNNVEAQTIREDIRSILKNLKITIVYEDIYGKEQPPLCRKLDWFGRNINNETREKSNFSN